MSDAPQPILDWRPVGVGDTLVFERAQGYRCKPRRIPARSAGALRVCVFGESLAAGFPLAPAFTPAIALEAILQIAMDGGRPVEVLDLAMPNMGPSEQLRVCEAAAQLRPDVCVFLTGNNWYYGLSVEPTASPEARTLYANEIEAQGIAGLAAEFRGQLASRAQVMIEALVQTARAAGAEVVLAIPPCNHEWERLNPPPLLGGGGTATWFAHFSAALTALNAGDAEAVLTAAAEMARLDAGSTGTPERLRFRALRSLGRDSDARDAAARAVDACNWQNHSWALPQVPTFVADLMRREAGRLDYRCVDLEPILATQGGGPVVGFRFFYDHCHLSVEGVRIAMAAIASRVLEALGVTDAPPIERLLAAAPRPTGLHAASAAFQGAHWASQFYPDLVAGDVDDRLCTALRAAVSHEPLLLDVMRDSVKLRSLACSPGLSATLPRAVGVPGVAAALTSTRLNPSFLEAVLAVWAEHRDEPPETLLGPIVVSYQARLPEGLDLTAPRFREWFWERTPTAWHDPNERQGSPLYRASWPESRFACLTDARQDLNLEVVLRLPGVGAGEGAGEGAVEGRSVTLQVNDGVSHRLELASPGWQRFRLEVPRAALRFGLNRVRLLWPALTLDEDADVRETTRRLRLGAEAELHALFGEVFSLRLFLPLARTPTERRA